MRVRVTSLNASFTTLVGWMLLLGVLTGRSELFVLSIPFVVALVAARIGSAACDYTLTHEVSTDQVLEGEPMTVTVTVKARTAVPLLELAEPLAPLADPGDHRNHAFFALRAGEQIRWRYELRPGSRQRIPLGLIYARAWDRSGLCVRETEFRDPKTVAVYPLTLPLRQLPRPQRTQPFVGNYVSSSLGEGIEPGDVRLFAPGDRIRQVNWRATLRRGQLYVTQRHRERNADVVLMLDTLASVGPAGATTLDAAARAAASLAAAYLARKDRVGLIEYGGSSGG